MKVGKWPNYTVVTDARQMIKYEKRYKSFGEEGTNFKYTLLDRSEKMCFAPP